jgi:hypothetical protein
MQITVADVLPHEIIINIGKQLPISMKFGSAADNTTVSLSVEGAEDIINRLQKAVNMVKAAEDIK